jgi:hypothetical protein
MEIEVKFQIDDMECEATATAGKTTKTFTATSVTSLLVAVNKWIKKELEKAGVNTGNV